MLLHQTCSRLLLALGPSMAENYLLVSQSEMKWTTTMTISNQSIAHCFAVSPSFTHFGIYISLFPYHLHRCTLLVK